MVITIGKPIMIAENNSRIVKDIFLSLQNTLNHSLKLYGNQSKLKYSIENQFFFQNENGKKSRSMFTSCTMSKSQDSMLTSFVFSHSLTLTTLCSSFFCANVFKRREERTNSAKKKNTKIIRMQINLNRIERCKRYM